MAVAVLIDTVSGEEYPLPSAGRVLLGRSHDCDIVIRDDGVSRAHARITITNDAFLLEDMDSRNGTYLDTQLITGPTPLQHGNAITIGRARFEFLLSRPDLSETSDTAPLSVDDIMLHGIKHMLPTRVSTHDMLADASKADGGEAAGLPERLAKLMDLNTVLASIRSENTLLARLAAEVGKAFPQADRCVVAMKGEGKQEMDMRAVAYSGTHQESAAPAPISAAIAKRVMERGDAILTSGAPIDVAFDAVKQGKAQAVGDVMCAPLWLGRSAVGVVYVDALPESEGFTKGELGLLVVVSKQASLLLQNVRVYEEVCRQKMDLTAQNERLRDAASERYDFTQIVGSSAGITSVIDQIKKASRVDSGVLIMGETGTGKELVAHAIHYNGPRRGKEFVTVNCAAIAKELQESELFGHEKGAFTGAGAGRKGMIEIADGGTLFLDEIGDMEMNLQAKLLRVVENKEVRRVGSARSATVDVRIIAATNKDLAAEVKQGGFRLDLYHRLNVFTIRVPPLSERREDIAELADHFLHSFSLSMGKHLKGFSREAMQILQGYPWPGNVREVKNAVERLVIEAEEGAAIGPGDLPWEIRGAAAGAEKKASGRLDDMVSAIERDAIEAALKKNNGNKSRTAEELGLSRGGLDRKLKRYGIDVPKQ